MVATTMPHIKVLLARLKEDHPGITFTPGDDYLWSATTRTLMYDAEASDGLYLLHELGHALLGHANFTLDIELLAQEREAWGFVCTELAKRYGVTTDDRIIQDSLETYRDWLHARSCCPRCAQTGLQTKTSTYVCINCRCSWRPNDARRCALRRYTLT